MIGIANNEQEKERDYSIPKFIKGEYVISRYASTGVLYEITDSNPKEAKPYSVHAVDVQTGTSYTIPKSFLRKAEFTEIQLYMQRLYYSRIANALLALMARR